MSPNTGNIYISTAEATTAGENPADLVYVTGSPAAIATLQRRVRSGIAADRARAKNKRAKAARRQNRSK